MQRVYTFPPAIRLKPREETVYIHRSKGTLRYNCEPKIATGIKKMMTVKLFRWPFTLVIEKGPILLDVLFHHKIPEGGYQCGIWFRLPHKVRLQYLPLFSCAAAFPKTIKEWRIPQRFWAWRVLTRSKKLIWKMVNSKCKTWAY